MIDTEKSQKEHSPLLEEFRKLAVGGEMSLSLNLLVPTQPPDDRENQSSKPIEVFYDKGRIVIQHGHHRFFTAKRNSLDLTTSLISVVKVKNPYLDY